MKKNIAVFTTALVVIVVAISTYAVAQQSTASELDLTGRTDVFVTYTGHNSTYTFKRPESWNVYEVPSMSYLRVENLDAGSLKSLPKEIRRQYFKIEVVVLPSGGLSLDEWVERQNTSSHPLPKVLEQRNIEVSGQLAVYQIEQFGSLIHPVVFVKKEDSVYIINFSNNKNEFMPVINLFLGHFTFNIKHT